jgi:protein-tyrosine phosphatase
MFQSVLILCIGNICRSPVAEGVLKKMSDQHQLGLRISSAGVHAMVDEPAQPHSITVAQEHYIDITQHQARQLTTEIIEQHELILVTDETVRKIAMQQHSFATGKIKKIGEFRKKEIQDPYLKSKEHFDAMYVDIEMCLQDWLQKVWRIKSHSCQAGMLDK